MIDTDATPPTYVGGDQLAQAPQAGQPTSNPLVFPDSVFGQWRDRPKGIVNDPDATTAHGVDPKFEKAVFDHVKQQIPNRIQQHLTKNDVRLIVTNMPIGNRPGRNIGVKATYVPVQGVLYVPERLADGKPNSNALMAVRHEFGHAFDHMLNASTDPAFLRAFSKDLEDHPKVRRNIDLRQFVPREGWSRQQAATEAFAEAFAVATQKPGANEGANIAFFKENFVQTDAYVESIVTSWLQPVQNR